MTEPTFRTAKKPAASSSRVNAEGRGRALAPLDRLPPHSTEAEQGVLGCILIDPVDSMGICVEKLKSNSAVFYEPRHQIIFDALLHLFGKLQPIDEITLGQYLRDQDKTQGATLAGYIGELYERCETAANLSYYLAIIREKYLRRVAIRIYTEGVSRMYDDSDEDTEKLLLEVEANASQLTEAETVTQEKPMKKIAHDVIDDMEKWHYKRGSLQLRGLPTGHGFYLDKILLGILPKDYIVIAGRPGTGKTSLAMNIVEYLAKAYVWYEETGEKRFDETAGIDIPVTVERKGIPVAIFSIEMDSNSLGYRLIFSRADVDMAEYNQGYSSKDDLIKLTTAAGQLGTAPIWIDDTPAQSIGQIAAKARRMVKQYGIKLFVLDYIQLVESDGGNGMDRVKELTKISRKIMALKKQLGVPWIILAQMNRNIETSESQRAPVLSDLKDCGAIEQDADKILFLYKPSRKKNEADEQTMAPIVGPMDWSKKPYRVDILVAKNRQGPTGVAEMLFCKNMTRFEDFHLWKVKHGLEQMKSGETKKQLGLPSNEELGM